MPSISVILPTYNEADNIADLITGIIASLHFPLEIIVVDDDSPDRTSEIVAALKASHPEIKLLRRNQKGLATAIADGIAYSSGDIIVWMDADLSQPAAVIPRLVSALDQHQIAVASRYVKHGRMRASLLRTTTSRLVNLWANLILTSSITDWTSGFAAVKREVFQEVSITPTGKGYGEYFIAFLFQARERGISITEIPYTYEFRKRGITKTSPSIFRLLGFGLSYCLTIVSLRAKL